MKDVMEIVKARGAVIVDAYLQYAAHVRKTTYDDLDRWKDEKPDMEADWPEYADHRQVVGKPKYVSKSSKETTSRNWLAAYRRDVQSL